MNTNIISLPVTNPETFCPELVGADTLQEWDMVIAAWSPRRAIATLGFLNKLVWKVATGAGALVKIGDHPDGGTEHRVDVGALQRLGHQSYAGLVGCKMALKGFSEYLARWWNGAIAPITALKGIREIRADLSALGMFDYEPGQVGSRAVPSIWAIDLPLVLQFYRHLERAYLRMSGGELAALPEHKGSNMVRLFNALFKGLAVYRKEGDDTSPQQANSGAVEEQESNDAKTHWDGQTWRTYDEVAETPIAWSVAGLANWMGSTVTGLGRLIGSSRGVDTPTEELPY